MKTRIETPLERIYNLGSKSLLASVPGVKKKSRQRLRHCHDCSMTYAKRVQTTVMTVIVGDNWELDIPKFILTNPTELTLYSNSS